MVGENVPFRPIRYVDLNYSYLEAGIQFSPTNLRSVPISAVNKIQNVEKDFGSFGDIASQPFQF